MLDWRELDPKRLASYWLAKVASGIEDYYAGEGESPGEWYGTGARALGLEGRIEPDDLTAVLRSEFGELQEMSHQVGPGHSPYSGGTKTVRRRPGWDFCFKAPKSVSLIYAFGDARARHEVVTAHEAAVKAALDYAERHLTRTRRSINGVRQHVKGNGLICALFRHRISRAGDPLLHTHALVVNATRDDRGKWMRLNAPWLLGPSKTLGYVYQAKLRAELSRRLGVEWQPVCRGLADVRGISRETIEAFSRRRQEILELLESRGQDPSQAKAAQSAAYETRRAKGSSLAPKAVREEWERYGCQVGLDESEITDALSRQHQVRPASPGEVRRVVTDLTDGQGLVREASSATEHEIVRAVCERLPNGGDLSAIEDGAQSVRESEEVVRLDPPERNERVTELRPEGGRYTTRTLLAAEREVVEAATASQVAHSAVARSGTLTDVLTCECWSTLRAEQVEMVRRLALGGERVSVVRGDAGTGKTFAIGAYREVMERSGWKVLGVASTRRAAAELGEVGIASTSIAAALAEVQRYPGVGLGPKTVVIVDEAATASTWDIRALLREINRADGKLVLVGDPRQLGAIGPGGVFRSLLERLEPIELAENVRQQLSLDREAIAAQKAERFGEALGIYAEGGRVEVCESPFLTRAAVVEGWERDADPDRSLMLARANREVSFLNRSARSRIEKTGGLTGPAIEVAGQPIQRGDLIVTRARAYAIGVRNQDRWRVLAVDAESGTLEVRRLPDGHRAHLDSAYLESRGWGGVPAIQHGYAGTIAIAQGATVDRIHVLLDGGLDARDIYTATTRSRAETRLYLTDATIREPSDAQPEPGRDLADPYDDVLRGVDRTRPEFAAQEERYRQQAKRMSEVEIRRRSERIERALASGPIHGPRRQPLGPWGADTHQDSRAELAAMREEVLVRERVELAAARRIQPPWLLSSLGPLPDGPAERRRWERQLIQVVRHRRRFGVRDRESALGDAPHGPEQTAARRRLESLLHEMQEQPVTLQPSTTPRQEVAEIGP